MKVFVLGAATGVILSLLVVGVLGQRKASWLAHYRFELVQPTVPSSVLEKIRVAEAGYYGDAPAWRRMLEEAQDALAILAPGIVYRLNLSVGPYRIKAKTVEDLLAWAIEAGYLRLHGKTENANRAAIAYFAEQPVLSDWEAAIYIEWLRENHPMLAKQSWESIAADPELIAKIYSGYMGAGGDMELWRNTLEPGAVARRRMGLGDSS